MSITSVGGIARYAALPVSTFVVAPMVTTAHHDLVLGVSIGDTDVSVTGVTDSVGNLYRFRVASNNSGNARVEIWEAQNILGSAALFINISLSAPALVSAIAWEYAGVHVESFPSPQDITDATGNGVQISCGVATSNIASWAVCFWGWQNIPDIARVGEPVERGTLRANTPISFPGYDTVGIALMDVRGYSAPVSGGYLIATPVAYLQIPVQWAAASLELRGSGAGSGGSGGTTPTNPPWQPPPSGDLVGFSYTFTVSASAPADSSSADVTCSYVQSVCDDDASTKGNQGY